MRLVPPPSPPTNAQHRSSITFGAACRCCERGHLEDDEPAALLDKIRDHHPADCPGPLTWCCWCCACGWTETNGDILARIVSIAELHLCKDDGLCAMALPAAA